MLKGKHLIAGEWVGGTTSFQNMPVEGAPDSFAKGEPEHVDAAAHAAEEAFWSYGFTERSTRAAFLRKIAEEIDARGAEITAMGTKETGLPEARLNGERGRTVGQLRLFADHIEAGDYLDRRHDEALPDRAPLPRPDLKMMQRPIGPVAVFGASNFPLAFSTAGGDTAAALAAGCPVVVKGHSAHPGVSDIVAQAIDAAVKACDLHPGVFSQIQGGNRAVGTALVQHPFIKAVGFTGSLAGGRAMFDLCAARPEPIPFFGELGSVNPMFVLENAAANRGKEIATGWAGSLSMGAGQFCTNPGVALLLAGPDADAFEAAAKDALAEIGGQTMLTEGIAGSYHSGADRMAEAASVRSVLKTECTGRTATPFLFSTTAEDFLANHDLAEEVFGPLGLIVIARDAEERLEVARSIVGQLTCTIHMDDADLPAAQSLMPILERKAGRLLVNGFPTGVEVSDTMVHGGPYPASTNFGATSVGTLSIRRFLRPVCYQNFPDGLLPVDLA
ncbi:aldehyde dehydrogenase (NADP(+)) [Aliiruegeria lutimaris]|uniref:NADP-dependent aldehyde dehydrogenase n=1 Tax=Aliiruegeria lutimaris TaxID=571298 RepID=A0A1G8R3L2_9RHOB|nr:aldehyde dehydrogenase (NADP(+)) [Aliiruegeria lutimaris]SDJ11574.1 NADP-dependent aldehyde dehydrogenase [Aliiruegeria lutimaris]